MTKTKALCVATRCTSAAQFIETFHRFCDEQSFFVATMNMRPVGLETPFSIQLADKTPVLRGLCVVLAAFTTPANQYKRPGIRLGIRRLTPESETVFYQLQAMRTAAPLEIVTEASEAMTETPVPIPLPPPPVSARHTPPPVPRVPTPRAGSTVTVPPKVDKSEPQPVEDPATQPVAVESRTPGSDLVLPANPLMNLTDESLEGFVDCTLYEETGNFFRGAPDDGVSLDEPIAAPSGRAFDLSDEPPTFKPDPVPVPPEPKDFVPPIVVDTSAPIDSPSRVTPMPAGERYSVIPPPRRGAPKRWLYASAAIAAVAAVALVLATKSSGEDDRPVEPAKPVEIAEPAKPVVDSPMPPTPPTPPIDHVDPPKPDGDELAAITNPPTTPVAGEGPCKLEVTTTPAGSMVQIDGQAVGPSPLTIAGPCTKRRVDVAHARYKAEVKWVTLDAEKPNTLDITLVRPTHDLTITSNPAGATVSIGGRRAGTTPTKLQLMGFSGIDVTIEKPGYEPVTKRVYSKRPADALSVTLKRALWIKKY